MSEDRAYLIVLEPLRDSFVNDATEAELSIVADHFAHLQKALKAGRLVLAGRAEDGHPGIVVIYADSIEQARAFVQDDPAVRTGLFTAQLKPFRLALLAPQSDHSTPTSPDRESP